MNHSDYVEITIDIKHNKKGVPPRTRYSAALTGLSYGPLFVFMLRYLKFSALWRGSGEAQVLLTTCVVIGWLFA